MEGAPPQGVLRQPSEHAGDAVLADGTGARVNAPSAALIRLAHEHGVSSEYVSWNGQPRACTARAMRAALAAMGVDASDDEACHAALDALEDERWSRAVPPATVMTQGQPREVHVHVPAGAAADVVLRLEGGAQMSPAQLAEPAEPRVVGGVEVARATFILPADLPLGYHELEVTVADGGAGSVTGATAGAGASATGSVIVTPAAIPVPESLRPRRPWGLMAQLYSVRSRASWGVGDLADLRDLCALAATRAGADFVLVNPLHACEPVPPLTPSPYLPTSRRFTSPLYIRVEDVPEVAYLPSARRAMLEWAAEEQREAALSAALLDRDAAWAAKSAALRDVFAAGRTVARQAMFDAFRAEWGAPLRDFATWCAIAASRASGEGTGTAAWPSDLASPSAAGIRAFQEDHADDIEFHEWLQWIADEQRAAAQEVARLAGMRIGVMTDLAVGVHPAGADAWALGEALARGVGVGAPPDMYNQQGQDWSQPPWQPRALEAAAYAPFRDVVRAALRHAGALRIDHVMGLFRLWWVPRGHGPDDGVYVRYDHEALVGVLALEAVRAGAMVIGEDLGTVEPWVREYLASRGVLGTTVMWFEKDHTGAPIPPERYRADALATVTTHDLPPTAAYLAGEHVGLRERLGLLVRPVDEVREEAQRERADMARMLVERGWAAPGSDAGDEGGDDGGRAHDEELLLGLHRALLASPALLVGVSLADVVGDVVTQNQPGTDTEYPNWRVPLRDGRGAVVPLDELFDHPHARAVLEALGAR